MYGSTLLGLARLEVTHGFARGRDRRPQVGQSARSGQELAFVLGQYAFRRFDLRHRRRGFLQFVCVIEHLEILLVTRPMIRETRFECAVSFLFLRERSLVTRHFIDRALARLVQRREPGSERIASRFDTTNYFIVLLYNQQRFQLAIHCSSRLW
jgi:hypothetical protein